MYYYVIENHTTDRRYNDNIMIRRENEERSTSYIMGEDYCTYYRRVKIKILHEPPGTVYIRMILWAIKAGMRVLLT